MKTLISKIKNFLRRECNSIICLIIGLITGYIIGGVFYETVFLKWCDRLAEEMAEKENYKIEYHKIWKDSIEGKDTIMSCTISYDTNSAWYIDKYGK